MKRVAVADVAGDSPGDGVVRRRLSDCLGTTDVAVNHYRVAPGESLPGGLHAHADQEEVFVVLRGTATFETLEGEVTLGEGEAVLFAPGEFQSGRNGGDADLVGLALGAPRGSEDVRLPLTCPDCDHPDLRLHRSEDGGTFACPDCGAEYADPPLRE